MAEKVKLELASRAIIESQLLVTLSDKSKVACVFDNHDLDALIAALAFLDGDQTSTQRSLLSDLRELRAAAFGGEGATTRSSEPGEIFNPPGVAFFDLRSGRQMKRVTSGPWSGWIVYKHPDGQWVSLRKANDVDNRRIDLALNKPPVHHVDLGGD